MLYALKNSILEKILNTKHNPNVPVEDEYDLMTIAEIFHGKDYEEGRYPGLIELVNIYMDTINLKQSIRSGVSKYIEFIGKRATGELLTPASWMRKFVENHPDYQQDSVVTPKINYDLVDACVKIGKGELHPADLLGDYNKDEKK